jgi:hypothetical protein
MARLLRSDEPLATGAALSPQASTALRLARFLVEFADPHFFLDSAPLDEFAEAADRLLGRLFISQRQLYHIDSCSVQRQSTQYRIRSPFIGRNSAIEELVLRNPSF